MKQGHKTFISGLIIVTEIGILAGVVAYKLQKNQTIGKYTKKQQSKKPKVLKLSHKNRNYIPIPMNHE